MDEYNQNSTFDSYYIGDKSLYEKYKSMSDEEIIKLHIDEPQAIDYILYKYKGFVKAMARRYFLMGGDCDDLIQEGMIGLFKAVQDYDGQQGASFFSFSRLCINRQMYSAIAASRRKKHSPLNTYVSFYEDHEESAPLIETMPAGQESSPEELFVSREYAELIESRLEESLSDLEKRVLYLHLRGTDYKTIARLLDKSPKTVDNALQRIKAKTAKILEREKE